MLACGTQAGALHELFFKKKKKRICATCPALIHAEVVGALGRTSEAKQACIATAGVHQVAIDAVAAKEPLRCAPTPASTSSESFPSTPKTQQGPNGRQEEAQPPKEAVPVDSEGNEECRPQRDRPGTPQSKTGSERTARGTTMGGSSDGRALRIASPASPHRRTEGPTGGDTGLQERRRMTLECGQDTHAPITITQGTTRLDTA